MSFEIEKIQNESIYNELEQKLVKFIEEHDFSSKEIKEAYFKILNSSNAADKEDVGEDVNLLEDKINQVIQGGVPLNRIARMIESKESYEHVISDYFEYIDSLNITEPEKKMLYSVIEKERNGEFSVFVNDDLFAEFEFDYGGILKSAKVMLLKNTLERIIKTIPEGSKYGFQFSEN